MNLIDTSSVEVCQVEGKSEDLTISLAEVTEVVKKLPSGKPRGVDESQDL